MHYSKLRKAVIHPPFAEPLSTNTLFQGGGGGGCWPDPAAISKTVAAMNVKFCRVLVTSVNVLKMLKLLTY